MPSLAPAVILVASVAEGLAFLALAVAALAASESFAAGCAAATGITLVAGAWPLARSRHLLAASALVALVGGPFLLAVQGVLLYTAGAAFWGRSPAISASASCVFPSGITPLPPD